MDRFANAPVETVPQTRGRQCVSRAYYHAAPAEQPVSGAKSCYDNGASQAQKNKSTPVTRPASSVLQLRPHRFRTKQPRHGDRVQPSFDSPTKRPSFLAIRSGVGRSLGGKQADAVLTATTVFSGASPASSVYDPRGYRAGRYGSPAQALFKNSVRSTSSRPCFILHSTSAGLAVSLILDKRPSLQSRVDDGRSPDDRPCRAVGRPGKRLDLSGQDIRRDMPQGHSDARTLHPSVYAAAAGMCRSPADRIDEEAEARIVPAERMQ